MSPDLPARLPALGIPVDGRLAHNVLWFARALRAAGLRVGPGRVVAAVEAVAAAGFTSREDFYWVLHASFVSRPEERAVFAQVFRLFWRDPRYLEQMMAWMIPALRGATPERPAEAAARRAAAALLDGADRPVDRDEPEAPTEIEIDAAATHSASERLRHLDFEQMTPAEMAEARRMVERLALPVRPLASRRLRPDARGAMPDRRATLARAMRRGGEIAAIARADRVSRPPGLVVICDISGSMAQYSRIVLRFVHAVANARTSAWGPVHAFTFATRLTDITRHLRARDADAALAAAGAEAQDWNGGTRIGACLAAFNRDWSRRVLGQGAVVLLVTDGLDREAPEVLGHAAERLALSARRLVWVNPLLRWEAFAPRAAGVRALLPHVSSLRAGHSIAALEDLARALADPGDAGAKARLLASARAG